MRPIIQHRFRSLRSGYFRLVVMCLRQVSLRSRWIPRYFTSSAWGRWSLFNLTGWRDILLRAKVACTDLDSFAFILHCVRLAVQLVMSATLELWQLFLLSSHVKGIGGNCVHHMHFAHHKGLELSNCRPTTNIRSSCRTFQYTRIAVQPTVQDDDDRTFFFFNFCVSVHHSIRLNKTPTWCNKMQILLLQTFTTCFGRHAPIIRSIKYWHGSHRYR